ncbi:ESX secretion-associated protein EspG [Hoyosella sp. YIM 151337]|uniref:ESX secretion-associated protein EspG n=1 Tax=Hoyosella sp. YIM 151337 TaxID=2992742 RepID=UPI0022361FAB|nr:ESX secretion-associated protein EspG [Hoyosella sp. YIM 151337]MCW4354641.1 ESX secretion-associated protein EspG [Hoyosella sp. YIM 151337]
MILTNRLADQLTDVTLTVSELAALQTYTGLDELPVALQIPLASASEYHISALMERGLIVDGYAHPQLAGWLRTLGAASHLVSVRRVTALQPERFVLARSDRLQVVPVAAVRTGDVVRISELTGSVIAPLRRYLGRAPSIRAGDVRAPREALVNALGSGTAVLPAESALRQIGAAPRDARTYSAGLTRITAMTEVTAGPPHADQLVAGIFDSSFGRFMTVPSGQGGSAWLTLCGSDEARITSLLRRMCG